MSQSEPMTHYEGPFDLIEETPEGGRIIGQAASLPWAIEICAALHLALRHEGRHFAFIRPEEQQTRAGPEAAAEAAGPPAGPEGSEGRS